MNTRQTGALVAVAVAALIVGALLGPRTQAQKAEEPPPAVRYVAVPGNDRRPEVVVIDTATGHCWIHPNLAGSPWQDWGSPAERK